jgi:dehydrogenase/reductase SDR family protein 7B
MRDFAGKTVWITGASSGIGEALAYALARKGARLILSARQQTELERVRAACLNPDQHQVLRVDLEAYEGLEKLADEVWESCGPIDCLVNNAGLSQRYLGIESSLALDERIMKVNFFGTTALTRPVLRKMLARGSGQIAVLSSVLGLYGIQTRTAYSASKHALRGYFNSLRNELVASPITISLIYPGYVRSKVSENALAADGAPYGKVDEGHKRAMSPADCAAQIVRALERDKAETIIAGPKEYLGVILSRYSPALFRHLSARMQV